MIKRFAVAALAATMLVGCSQNNITEDIQVEGDIYTEETVAEIEKSQEKQMDMVLYEGDDYKATLTSFVPDSGYGAELKVLLENNTDGDVTVQVRDCSVNGFMIDPICSADVAAGKKANTDVSFYNWDLEENSINSIDTIELSLLFITDGYEDRMQTKQITIAINDTEDSNEAPAGDVVYNQDGIKIIYIDTATTEYGDVRMNMYIENNTDRKVLVQARDTSVNGFMVDPIISSDIMPGKKVNTALKFNDYDLEDNSIMVFEEVESTLKVIDSEDFLADAISVPFHVVFE